MQQQEGITVNQGCIIYKHMERLTKWVKQSLYRFLQLPDTRAKDVMLELSSISDQRLADEWKVQTSFVRKSDVFWEFKKITAVQWLLQQIY